MARDGWVLFLLAVLCQSCIVVVGGPRDWTSNTVHGSGNPINVVKAVEAGLRQLKTRKSVEQLRGVKLEKNAGTWRHKQTKAGARKAAEAEARGL